jgi:uncharacterized membrane protein
MTWHYANGADQYGPDEDSDLDRLHAPGTITPETLLSRQAMPAWRPLREARPAPVAATWPAAPAAEPRVFTPVVATAEQRLPPVDVEALFQRAAGSGRGIAIVDSLKRGWELVFADPASSIGVSALVILAMIGAGFVPCVGSIVQLIATGPLVASWYQYFLKRIRGQHTEWGDAIAAFSSPMLSQLIIEHIVTTVITLVVMIPVGVVFFVSILGAVATMAADERMAPLAVIGFAGLFLVTFAVMIYLTIAWMFALPLILDKHIDFWPAMKLSWRVANRYFFPLLGLLLLCGLIYLAGILALCVGLFVALPICVAALAYTYEDLFAEPPAA